VNEFARFEKLLNHAIGLDARSVGAAMIERAVRERCAACGASDIEAYWRQVKESPAEMQELVELVIVPETWFFRDDEAFKTIARLALTHSLRSARPLRLLSLPCSTGEEPYSMAMALLDAGVPPARFRIDAVDICTRSIATAERAVYGRNSFRGKDLEFRGRHFVPMGGNHMLAGAVRSQVRFRHGNLFDLALLAEECTYDFVFCRNVLIYFGEGEQARAVKVLGRLLNDTGMLFVGPSECGVLVRENMVSANIPLAFAFRRAALATPSQPKVVMPFMRFAGSETIGSWTPGPAAAPARPMHDAARSKVSSAPRLAPAVETGSDNDPVVVAARLANQGRLVEAAELCKRHVREHKPTAAAFYLLGLVSDAAGRHPEARDYYRKTLYLDPDHREALVHLAALLDMHGDTAGARRMNDRARRAITKQDDSHG
jgi:chemotaxis protein methyltransferase WspC